MIALMSLLVMSPPVQIERYEGVPWVEIGVRLRTEADPRTMHGLGAVTARTIDAALRASPACGGVCGARVDGDGITIHAGATPDGAEAELSRIFEVIRAAGTEGSVEREVRSAAAAVEALRSDDRRLVYYALMQVLFAGHPAQRSPLGDVVGVSRATADDVAAFVRRNLVGARVSIRMAGALDDAAAAWAPNLEAGAPVTSTVAAPKSVERVRVVVVDKPDRDRVQLAIGWPVDDKDAAALEIARLAWGGTVDSPLARLAQERDATAVAQLVRRRGATAAVVELTGSEAETPQLLDAVLAARRTVKQRGLGDDALQRGRTAFEVRRALAARDAAAWVHEGPAAPADAPDARREKRGVRALVRGEGLVAVVLASATPELLARLAALPQVDEVAVFAYDHL
ncbi:MAG: hypothetical protein RMA76_14960 [Deltaproteobacteria bacterium]|jgi:hypothetical protein